MWAATINILLGLWLMISPYLLHFEKTASNSNYIVAPLVLTCAIMALWEINRSTRYFNVAAGAWLAVCPFILNFQAADATWNSIVSGILIAAFSFVKGTIKGKYGGGWKSLF